MESNYEKQVYIARDYFLKYDQNKIIKKYSLKSDADYLYLYYIGTEYRIKRSDGVIERRKKDGSYQICKEYTTVMALYDLLCYSKEETVPSLTGQWQPIGSFTAAGNSPSAEYFAKKYEQAFTGKVEAVEQACIKLNGKLQPRLAGADLTFEMPVVPWFSVLFQYWDADEEFPAKILLLWDKASLSYLHFETTYYCQGDLLESILQKLN